MKNLLVILLLILFQCGIQVNGQSFKTVVLVRHDTVSTIEQNVLALLESRIKEKSKVDFRIETTSSFSSKQSYASGTLIMYAGVGTFNPLLNKAIDLRRIAQVNRTNPGQEGFLLKSEINIQELKGEVLMAGVDNRGLLYAVGEFLRQCNFQAYALQLESFQIRKAPAFEVRGTQYGQSSVAFSKGKVRPWTKEEKERAILDLALAGANTFMLEKDPIAEKIDFDFLKSFDLLTCGVFNPNMPHKADFPVEWRAAESIGRLNYVCPSIPEAYEFMLQQSEERFKSSVAYDFIQLKGGDGGGCECDRCRPYGKIFIELSEKIARVIHKHYPKARIYFTNQKFDNESDRAILEYLNESPRKWLWAWGYGPGSDATSWQPGHRQNHRMDLFDYPGFGPYGLYPKELLHQLPPHQKIVYFNEVTHWRYAQHAYIQMYPRADKEGNLPPSWSHEIYERRPDQKLTMAYDRLTFYAWPVYYHRVFNDLMRYGVGDITHSSGNHDHFNQWMWQRLLWNPRLSVQEVVHEYAQNWFGIEAAELMEKAILQLEPNMEELENQPLESKIGIEDYYRLVSDAGRKMPSHLMKNNWLWRMYMQKGALDRYIQLHVREQMNVLKSIEKELDTPKNRTAYSELMSKIEKALHNETSEMRKLKSQAMQLGEESNHLFGTRSEAMFNLEHDYIGLGWVKRQLVRVQQANNEREKSELIAMITDYEGIRSGAIYDNLGTGNQAPNVTFGYPYDHGQPYINTMLSEANRPSQRSMHFTQDESHGVTLLYKSLKPGQNYRFRLSMVRPVYQERYVERMKQHSQSLYANGTLLVEQLEVPAYMSDYFTYEIPDSLIRNGELEIKLMHHPPNLPTDRVAIEQWRNTGGWGTIVSEAWLFPIK